MRLVLCEALPDRPLQIESRSWKWRARRSFPVATLLALFFLLASILASSGCGGAISSQSSTASPTSGSASSSGSASGSGAAAHQVDLSWNPSTSAVSGYRVYRGSQSGGPYSAINGSLDEQDNYSDSTVQGGVTYYYVVTAVDAAGVESGYSNEVVAAVPSS